MSGFVGRPVTCAERDEKIYNEYMSDRSITREELGKKYGLAGSSISAIVHRQKKLRGLLKDKKRN